MTGTHVRVEHRGAVAIVWIDNPPDQFFTITMVPELVAACDELERDPDILVAVLASRHATTFMGYLDPRDLRRLADHPDQLAGADIESLSIVHRALDRLSSVRPLTIAALNGHAWGAGCELALACDLRFMTDAPRAGIAMLEATLGLTPGAGASHRLRALMGAGRAFHFLVTAKALGAVEAHAAGLVDEVLPREGFFDHVLDRARQLTFHTHDSIRNVRRCIRPDEHELAVAHRREQAIYAQGLSSRATSERVQMLLAHAGDGQADRPMMSNVFPAFLLESVFRRKPDLLVHGLIEHFDPERADGIEGAYGLEITGRRGGAWTVRVRNGELQVDPGLEGPVDVTMRATAKDWIDFVTGRVGDVELFVSGRMRVYGNVLDALQFKSFFV